VPENDAISEDITAPEKDTLSEDNTADEDEAINMSDAEIINLALSAIVSNFYECVTEKLHDVRDKRLKAIELSLSM